MVGTKDKTLGSNIVSEVTLAEIDLSNLIGITPIDNRTKKRSEPNKTPSYNLLSHTRRIADAAQPWFMVMLPKLYLPIANEKSNDGAIPPYSDTDDYQEVGL